MDACLKEVLEYMDANTLARLEASKTEGLDRAGDFQLTFSSFRILAIFFAFANFSPWILI